MFLDLRRTTPLSLVGLSTDQQIAALERFCNVLLRDLQQTGIVLPAEPTPIPSIDGHLFYDGKQLWLGTQKMYKPIIPGDQADLRSQVLAILTELGVFSDPEGSS